MSVLRRAWRATWKIALFCLVWAVLLAPAALIVEFGPEAPGGGLAPATRLWFELLGAGAVLLAGWIVLRFVDRRPFRTLGFSTGGVVRDLALGSSLGAAMVLLALGLLWIPGWLEISSSERVSWSALALLGGGLLFNSVTQEVLVRGYVLQTIEREFDVAVALLASSAVFVALHAGAILEGGPLPALNLFGAGILLGLAYTTTRNLWLPVALHFSWNCLQGPVLGIAVTGQALDGGWRLVRLEGPPLFTGGAFGLEAGLAATAATAAGIAFLAVLGGRMGGAHAAPVDGRATPWAGAGPGAR